MCTNHPQNNDDSYTQKCVMNIVWLTIKNINTNCNSSSYS